MKRTIIFISAAAAAAVLIVCAVLFPMRRENSQVSVLRAPVPSADDITTSPSPSPSIVLVKSDGFQIEVSNPNGGELIYDYGNLAEQPYVTVYSTDGRTKIIRPYDVEEYESVGWMEEMPEKEGLTDLNNSITEYISEIPGEWGVYIKRLDTNEYLSINERQYSGASLIKLFTMAAVYNEIAAGSIQKTDDIRESLSLMITESSNIDCNELTEALGGGDAVKGFEVENRNTGAIGCKNTIHQSELVDGTGETTFVGFNRTSPADCARVLELIYKRKLVSESASDEMLDLLKRQERTWKIPSGLPEGTMTANKTGETDTVEADAAIVYSPACDYVICVIGNGDISSQGVENIQTVSKMTYEYFNK